MPRGWLVPGCWAGHPQSALPTHLLAMPLTTAQRGRVSSAVVLAEAGPAQLCPSSGTGLCPPLRQLGGPEGGLTCWPGTQVPARGQVRSMHCGGQDCKLA